MLALQTDPYTVARCGRTRCVDGRPAGPPGLDAGTWTAEQMAQVALDSFADAGRTDSVEPADSVEELLQRPFFADPLRRHDIAPITDGASAIVLAAGDRARNCVSARPGSPVSSIASKRRSSVRADLTTSPSTAVSAQAATGGDAGSIEVAELHAPFSHQQLILTEAIGLGIVDHGQPVGRRAGRQPDVLGGLERIGFAAQHIWTGPPGAGARDQRAGAATELDRAATSWRASRWRCRRTWAAVGWAPGRPSTSPSAGRLDERPGARGHRQGLADSGSTFDDIDAVVVGKAPDFSRAS